MDDLNYLYILLIFIGLECILLLIRRNKAQFDKLTLKQSKLEVQDMARIALNNPYPQLRLNKKGDIVFINPAAMKVFPDITEKLNHHDILAGVMDAETRQKDILVREISYKNKFFNQTIVASDDQDLSGGIIVYCYDVTDRKKS